MSLAEGAHSYTIGGQPRRIVATRATRRRPRWHLLARRSTLAAATLIRRSPAPLPPLLQPLSLTSSSSTALSLHSPTACNPPRDPFGLSRASGVTFGSRLSRGQRPIA